MNYLDKTNVYTFYDDIVTAIIQYNGSKEVGQSVSLTKEEILEIMDKIKSIEREISNLRVKIRRENNFNEKVELNIKIKGLQNEIEKLQGELKDDGI